MSQWTYFITESNLVHQFSFPAETFCHIWLPLRLIVIFGFRRYLFLPAETTVHRKWHSAETPHDCASY